MSLLPDEIAHRSFTPSADGYHQGEVRAFLERMAREQRALLASMPEGQRLVVDLTMAVAAQETRLAQLEQRLETTVTQLEEVATTVEQTQDRAMQQLAAASRVAGEQQQLLIDLTTAIADAKGAAAALEPGAGSAPAPPPTTEPTAPAPPPTTESSPDAATAPSDGEAAPSTSPAAAATTTQPVRTPMPGSRDARISPRPAPRPAAVAAEPPASVEPAAAPPPPATVGRGGDSIPEGVIGVRLIRSAPPLPAPAETPAASAAPPDENPAALLAAIGEQEPLIAENVNDLLDGVLDDVLGNITEGPPTP